MTDVIERLNSELRGRYAIQKELGAGGMATVYLAEDIKHHRQVAVKVLRHELSAAVGAERFLKEIEIAAGLRHPHILPLHDSGQAGEFLFYVMPFVEGESLRDRLNREKQLAIDEAVRIAREVAEALAYAHARGVIHRDIKPANIMLESGHAVVADFGIAFSGAALGADRLTDSGLSPGTPLYMSPEQAGGERNLDARSDVYSVGCVLYEMLGGDPPFAAATVQAITARKMVDSVPSLQVVRDTIPDALERITLKALARTPADRFTTAGEFASALATVEAHASGASYGVGGLAERRSAGGPDRAGAGTPPAFGSAGTDPSAASTGRWKQVAGYGLLGFIFLTVVGFLNTQVVDIKLNIPAPYTPSREDFPVVGLRALVPPIFYGAIVLVAYALLRYLSRLLGIGVRHVPRVGETLDAWPRRVYGRWMALWQAVDSSVIAETFFVAAALASVGVIWGFWPLLGAMFTGDTEILACSYRPLHRSFDFSMTVLVMSLLVGWRLVYGYLRLRGDGGRVVEATRWGSLVGITLVVLLMTLPWRMMWDNQRERATIDGDQAYILFETDAELVLYNAEERSTGLYGKPQAGFERRRIMGYVFEEPEVFASGEPECESVTQ